MPQISDIALTVQKLIAEQATKTASAPGQGKTTFPQDSVDDGESEASEGARGRENASDVEEVVPHASVESTTAPSSESQDAVQPQIGVTQSETGGDPSVEDDYEAKLKDPGTDATARVDDGPKYASWSLAKLAAEADRLAAAATKPVATATKPAVKPTPKEAAAVGYADAAAAAAGEAGRRFVLDTIKEARHSADLVVAYLPYYLQKAAEGGVPPEAIPPEAIPADAPPPDAAPAAGGDPVTALEDAIGDGDGDEAMPLDAPPTADEAIDGFNGAADDMQITPEILEQLLQLLQQRQQGDPAAAQKAAKFQKIAAAAVSRRMAGKHTIGPPKTARARALRDSGRRYLAEVVATARTPA